MLSSPEFLFRLPAPRGDVLRRKAHDGSAEDSIAKLQQLAAWLVFFLQNFRAISTARLNVSPRLHLRPINVVVSDGPWRDLILERASCLDAFSTYPHQTLLPGGAPRRDNRYTGGLSSTVLSY